ncbi:CatB-related O-acetyltransferase [Fulvivirgaceae bacterium PWU4]|uniref:CatB-related O-acetyltransferase n=1 Tax=Chryseosolibacter histidini TaxID=2782349 RepID=A0AAP2GKY7_9BACT|nr:DapH/DapD/GlmU-related protein [Chryseosolibacter histidini]MBT1699564.1 CatB-related O-acetyltransferase [Chryseosolibacter histidini]
MSLIRKIPVLRALVRFFERRSFEKQWRSRNPHNETKVGDRFFPMEVVQVGKGTYGTITVQSLYVTEKEKLVIGNYVSIAPDVTFFLGVNHQINTATTFPFYSKLIKRGPIDAISNGPVVVEDEVWIGTGARIFSGVRIGKGAIVAAGALVTKDVPPYAIVGGNPARLIRFRFTEEVINILKPICFVDFSDAWIRKNIDMIYKKIETVEDALQLKALADSYKTDKE